MSRADLKREAAAWRAIGRRIEAARAMPRGFGLCAEVWNLFGEEYANLRTNMTEEARSYATFSANAEGPYAFACGEEWEARCIAAYWLALECEEEARHATD